LKATWARFSLIGDLMRASNEPLAGKGFALRISAMIADEPTILAPTALKAKLVLRPGMVSLGLAASLAVVAVLVGKSMNEHASVFQAASHGNPTQTQIAANVGGRVENPADSQFNDYLVMHNETASMAGSAGMLPYVRLVGSRPSR